MGEGTATLKTDLRSSPVRKALQRHCGLPAVPVISRELTVPAAAQEGQFCCQLAGLHSSEPLFYLLLKDLH